MSASPGRSRLPRTAASRRRTSGAARPAQVSTVAAGRRSRAASTARMRITPPSMLISCTSTRAARGLDAQISRSAAPVAVDDGEIAGRHVDAARRRRGPRVAHLQASLRLRPAAGASLAWRAASGGRQSDRERKQKGSHAREPMARRGRLSSGAMPHPRAPRAILRAGSRGRQLRRVRIAVVGFFSSFVDRFAGLLDVFANAFDRVAGARARRRRDSAAIATSGEVILRDICNSIYCAAPPQAARVRKRRARCMFRNLS